jgi:hypothetical protein
MHIRNAWEDYFTGTPTNYNSTTYGTTRTLSDTNVYVSNCLFRSMTSGSHGGALCCTSVSYLLVESTSFFTCKTSGGHGGAIYFSNSGGQCVLQGVCGYDCCSTYTSSSYGQFLYTSVNNGASSKNYVNYSSISRSVIENSNSYYTLHLLYGKICCPSVNSSMNKCYRYSGIFCNPLSNSNSFTCSVSYASFTDNTAAHYTCIYFWTGGANYKIESCNILRNIQGGLDTGGTIFTCGNVMIEYSCILENTATYIFRVTSSYTITLSNCTVDSTSNSGYLTIKNTVTKSFILALNHMSTRNCHSGYDSAGYLTPIIETPSSSKKQRLCYTCNNSLYQSRLRYLVSLMFVFGFKFINLDGSGSLW